MTATEKKRLHLEPRERITLVKSLFSRVVDRYDLMNRVLSLGRDRFWRRATARRARTLTTGRLLDLAAGTGDQALELAREHPAALVLAFDFTEPMLQKARDKIGSGGANILLSLADALALPLPGGSVDCVTMAFGIRNIPDRLTALREMHRVLVPGGRCLVLELTFPRWSLVRRIYDAYLNRLIPGLGALFSGQRGAYQYLADSIMDFPPPEALCGLMAEAGFSKTGFVKFTFGVAVLHWAEK